MKLRLIIFALFITLFISCSVDINTTNIEVRQGSYLIESKVGFYNFGSHNVGRTSQQVTFSIYNLGHGNVYLTGKPQLIQQKDDIYGVISIDEANTNSVIQPGKSSAFKVSFTPKSVVTYFAKILIPTSSKQNNPYIFTVVGTGVRVPEINVRQGSTDIPSKTGKFEFGRIRIGKTTDPVVFIIENQGLADLELKGSPKIAITGEQASMFAVYQTSTASLITQGSATTFSIRFKPTKSGASSATISIINTDSDENPYTFSISGRGTIFDFNGDGIDDVIVGASRDDDGGTDSGCAFIYLGKSNHPAKIISSEADVTLVGDEPNDHFGMSVCSAGDVNGDGYDDVIVGSSDVDEAERYAGCAYIFFGRPKPPSVIDASDANVKLLGEERFDRFASTVSTAGDVNGDGYDDVIVGSIGDNEGGENAGCAFIFFGNFYISNVRYASYADVRIIGVKKYDRVANSVSTAGDINGDGYDDIIIGDYNGIADFSESGSVYIFFGRSTILGEYKVSDADVKLIGDNDDDYFGYSVNSVGDFNNDGFNDIIVGAMWDDDGGEKSGCAFLFFGRKSFPSSIFATNANVKFIGEKAYDYFGESVSGAGDINGDGYNDIIIGAIMRNSTVLIPGSAYVYYGKANPASEYDGLEADIKITGLNTEENFAGTVSTSGDFNDDGFTDVIIGSSESYYDKYPGFAYIFYGGKSITSSISSSNANIKLTSTGDSDMFGNCVASGK